MELFGLGHHSLVEFVEMASVDGVVEHHEAIAVERLDRRQEVVRTKRYGVGTQRTVTLTCPAPVRSRLRLRLRLRRHPPHLYIVLKSTLASMVVNLVGPRHILSVPCSRPGFPNAAHNSKQETRAISSRLGSAYQ